MHNRVIRMAAVACTLSILAGCTIQLDPAESNSNPISFNAGSALLRDDATKAAYYDDTSFGVFAFKQSGGTWALLASKHWKPNFMFNQEVHYESPVYSYNPTRYWPDPADGTLTFWAYSPYDADVNVLASGSTSTAYTSNIEGLPDMRWTVDGQTDILYSNVVADQTSASNSGVVEFAFNHALSRVDIKAEKIDAGGLYEVTLKEVSFKGIYATGILKSSDWSWYSYSGSRQDLPVWSGSTVLNHGTATPTLASVLPLPQSLTNDACWLHLEFDVSYHENPSDPSSPMLSYSTSRNAYLRDVFYSVGEAWSKNSHYTVTIQISPDRPIQFTVSWDDWGAEHNYHLSS